ncbi:hypothetical protein ISN45_At05g057790 [Arabidopsis thaliana x Arabidopsis arenosa]|uniref:Transmembrane protein n=2 Tax=Arabidopsis TaxID=3701 RepID=A0A178UNL0_ARATH|nr:hypothetical protein ISN45_At05g057790 [Arabidopsis thaliana x Arabidopsis arenosa]OAO95253.1 hypothetical protein AXX17_AT5G61170 [Arabidopsis thaliana]
MTWKYSSSTDRNVGFFLVESLACVDNPAELSDFSSSKLQIFFRIFFSDFLLIIFWILKFGDYNEEDPQLPLLIFDLKLIGLSDLFLFPNKETFCLNKVSVPSFSSV